MSERKWPRSVRVTKIVINGRPWGRCRRVMSWIDSGDTRMIAWLALAFAVCVVGGIFIDHGCRF